MDGVNPDDIPNNYPFDIDLAWQTFLIDTFTNGGNVAYLAQFPLPNLEQEPSNKRRTGEWDFTFGGNYDERLYLGFTLGIASLRYEEESTWEEKDNLDTIPNFTSFQYNQDLKTTGSGINLKFGAIFRPADAIRINVPFTLLHGIH